MMDIQSTSVRVKYDKMKIITEEFFIDFRKIKIQENYLKKISAMLILYKFA